MDVTLAVGHTPVTLDLAADRLIPFDRPEPPQPLTDPAAAVRAALESPLHFPPLRRALTPDDAVTVVVDERLPDVAGLLAPVLEHVTSAGVAAAAITLLCPPSASRQAWLAQLPEEFESVRVETHDPADQRHLSYLATTKAGRRLYLNRALTDAAQVVVLTGRRYDPLLGVGGGAGELFPAFGDAATHQELDAHLSMDVPGAEPWPARREAEEAAWLLGAPFFVQVIEAAGDAVAGVIAGSVEAVAEGRVALDRRWRGTAARPAATVLAAVSGDPARQDAADLARALACAARVVEPDGRIVLLTEATPALGEGFDLIRQAEDSGKALKLLGKQRPADRPAAFQWLQAVQKAHVYLLSGLPVETAEELFVTPLDEARQAQRLLDGEGGCLVLPDAHKTMAVLADS